MHSIKNVSERNKIDTQPSADAYIRRKRLISKSDYNLKSWNWNPKNSGQIYKKKTQKNQKNPLGWVFSNPACVRSSSTR